MLTSNRCLSGRRCPWSSVPPACLNHAGLSGQDKAVSICATSRRTSADVLAALTSPWQGRGSPGPFRTSPLPSTRRKHEQSSVLKNGSARNREPRSASPRPGLPRRSPRPSRTGLWLVHRGFDTPDLQEEGAARGARCAADYAFDPHNLVGDEGPDMARSCRTTSAPAVRQSSEKQPFSELDRAAARPRCTIKEAP